MFTPTKLAIVTILSLAFTPLSAQDFDKGVAAYEAGDYTTALQEWQPLAEQGDAVAQMILGSMYKSGEVIPQNYTEAVKWFLLAAEQGDVYGQLALGTMYSSGEGVPQNYSESMMWNSLAAKQGNAGAQFSLGAHYGLGQGVSKDNVMAHMWFNVASANGYALARRQRDKTAAIMTSADVFKAQAMATKCMDSDYTKCGL